MFCPEQGPNGMRNVALGTSWLALLLIGAAPAAAKQEETLSQRELNYGYASLHGAVKGMRHSDKIFLVKLESDACEKVVRDLSASMDRITARLEELARADPRLSLEDDGMPE